MKHYNFVRRQVIELQLFPLLDDIGVFAHHQPADVSEEEAPDGVVRVGISLRIFMVNPVVSSPLIDIILWVPVKTDITHTLRTQRGRCAVMKAAIMRAGTVCVCVCVPEMTWSWLNQERSSEVMRPCRICDSTGDELQQ